MSKPEGTTLFLDPNTPWGRSVTPEDFHQMVEDGGLKGELLERFWRMNDFQSEMPAFIEIQVNRRDIDKLIRQLKREKAKRR